VREGGPCLGQAILEHAPKGCPLVSNAGGWVFSDGNIGSVCIVGGGGGTASVNCTMGAGLAGRMCSRRPWKMLPSRAAAAASASPGSMNCTRAKPLDLREDLRHQPTYV